MNKASRDGQITKNLIMERIVQNIGRHRLQNTKIAGERGYYDIDGQAAVDLALIHSHYDISSGLLAFPGGRAGLIVSFTRQLVRRLLRPILERQTAYNAAQTRLVTSLLQRRSKFQEWEQRLERRPEEYFEEQVGLRSSNAALMTELVDLKLQIKSLGSNIAELEQQIVDLRQAKDSKDSGAT